MTPDKPSRATSPRPLSLFRSRPGRLAAFVTLVLLAPPVLGAGVDPGPVALPGADDILEDAAPTFPASSSAPGAPTGLQATGGTRSVALSWNAPLASGGAPTLVTTSTLLPTARSDMGAAWVAPNGFILGGADSVAVDKIVRHDPAAGTTQTMSATLAGTRYSAPTVALGGKVYVFGGCGDVCPQRNAIRYDPTTSTATTVHSSIPQGIYTSAVATDGTDVYLFGGRFCESACNLIWKYSPSANAFTTLAARLPSATQFSTAVWDGRHVYVFGGHDDSAYLDRIVRFDPATGSVTTMAARLPSARIFMSGVWDGQAIYLFGGELAGGARTDQVLRYDPAADAVQVLDVRLPSARSRTAAVWDGQAAYVYGGNTGSAKLRDVLRFTPTSTSPDTTITSYRVYAGSTSGALFPIANVTAPQRAYNETGLADGQTRHYQVSALRGLDEGPRSAEASATTQPAENDCGNGRDAGDTFQDAMPIGPLRCQARLSTSNPDDWFRLPVKRGDGVRVTVRSLHGGWFTAALHAPSSPFTPTASHEVYDSKRFETVASEAGEWRVHVRHVSGPGEYEVWVYAGATSSSLRAKPIMYVHGAQTSSSVQMDLSDIDPFFFEMEQWGWKGTKVAWGFYACDKNADHVLDHHGKPGGLDIHNVHLNGDSRASEHGAIQCKTTERMHTPDTEIQHLAYHWAWAVYDHYQNPALVPESQRTCVEAIGHSMGGLVIRYAIAMVGTVDFPPTLCVENVVTLGTPHGGTDMASYCGFYDECNQQEPADPFIGWLRSNAPNPQGTGGTVWTAIGSTGDTIVEEGQATDMAANRTVVYEEPIEHSDAAPRCFATCRHWKSPDVGPTARVRWDDAPIGNELTAARMPWPHRFSDMSLAHDAPWGCGAKGTDSVWTTYEDNPLTGEFFQAGGECWYKLFVWGGLSHAVVRAEGAGAERKLDIRSGSPDGTLLCTRMAMNPTCAIRSPTEGFWYVRLSDVDGLTDPFTLSITFYQGDCLSSQGDAGDFFGTARSLLTLEQTCLGNLLPVAGDLEDWYRFDLVQGQAFDVSITPAVGSDVGLCVSRPSGGEVQCADQPAGSVQRLKITATEAGAWRVKVYARGANGNYTMTTARATPPTLSFLGTGGYASDGVNPDAGESTETFTYRVKYADLDGTPPQYVHVSIDGAPSVPMYWESGSASTGIEFSHAVTLPAGSHSYQFRAGDGTTDVRFPATGSFSGPSVTAPNRPPTLSFTGETNFQTDGVNPGASYTSTTFTWRVAYSDPDGTPPQSVRVHVDGDAGRDMTLVSGSASSGIYSYSTTLPSGTHTYRFTASDGKAGAALPASGTLSGPVVTVPNDCGTGVDAGNVHGSATPIQPVSGCSGTIVENDWADWYKVFVNNGQRITASMTPGAGEDFDLYILRPGSETAVAWSLNKGSTDTAAFTADEAGEWRVKVHPVASNGVIPTGGYSLSVSLGALASCSSGGGQVKSVMGDLVFRGGSSDTGATIPISFRWGCSGGPVVVSHNGYCHWHTAWWRMDFCWSANSEPAVSGIDAGFTCIATACGNGQSHSLHVRLRPSNDGTVSCAESYWSGTRPPEGSLLLTCA